jgi:Acetyltransferase (GNAT) domain
MAIEMCESAVTSPARAVQTGEKTVYEIQPLHDRRWSELVDRHPRSSVFHTSAWLNALHRTYAYEPVAYTTSPPDCRLEDGLAFCRVASWITGRRLVSLPFSDHCEPLALGTGSLARLIAGVESYAKADGCRYAEIRPASAQDLLPTDFGIGRRYFLHRLDLRAGATELFRQFHKDCIQRKIRRAEREGLDIRQGRDAGILKQFYGLVVRTRRRQGLPPQPVAWFRNVLDCMGESAVIRLATSNGRPIAGIFTLQYRNCLYYKYGASDARFHNLGAMPFLFWHAIQHAIRQGLEELDMGRSDCNHAGLIAFKEHLGARRSLLAYWRSPPHPATVSDSAWRQQLGRLFCRYLPSGFLTVAGRLLYRHIG